MKLKKKNPFEKNISHKKKVKYIVGNHLYNFFEIMPEILTNVPSDRIINFAETNWQVVKTGEYTWAKTRAEHLCINSCLDGKIKFNVR